MLFDFGLDPRHFDEEETVRRKIEEIDDTFDMVLIADRFEESVVLLREALCWTHEDVSYLKLNARRDGKKSPLSDAARTALKDWLRAGWQFNWFFLLEFSLKNNLSFGLRFPKLIKSSKIGSLDMSLNQNRISSILQATTQAKMISTESVPRRAS